MSTNAAKDTALRDAVVNELEADPEVAAKHVSVTAIDGAITLGGHVAMIHEKHVAVRAAERVPGVKAVADDIDVIEPSLHERADDEIAVRSRTFEPGRRRFPTRSRRRSVTGA